MGLGRRLTVVARGLTWTVVMTVAQIAVATNAGVVADRLYAWAMQRRPEYRDVTILEYARLVSKRRGFNAASKLMQIAREESGDTSDIEITMSSICEEHGRVPEAILHAERALMHLRKDPSSIPSVQQMELRLRKLKRKLYP